MSGTHAPPVFHPSLWEDGKFAPVLWHQNLGTVFSESDLKPPTLENSFVVRPFTDAALLLSGASEVQNGDGRFIIRLSVKFFHAEELLVKVDNYRIIVTGEQRERADLHGYIDRRFARHYPLPHDSDVDDIESYLNSQTGILTILVVKKKNALSLKERIIRISTDPDNVNCMPHFPWD